MNSEPLVSIVLPTYNGEKYLATAIQSCLDQSYKHWELIIVDDCSKDRSPEIIVEYAKRDDRIHSIRNDPNKKLPGSLNAGFAQAKGDLLTWTSDDNAYRPEAIAKMAQFMETHPEIGLVYCDYTNIDESGSVINTVQVGAPEDIVHFCVVGACFMYRRNVKDKVGMYDEGLFCAEDFDYWLRVAQHFSIARLSEDLYLYRQHGGSLTATQRDKMLAGMEKALVKSLPHISFAPRNQMAKGYLTVASLAYRRHATLAALRFLMRASLFSGFTVVSHLYNGLRKRGLEALTRR